MARTAAVMGQAAAPARTPEQTGKDVRSFGAGPCPAVATGEMTRSMEKLESEALTKLADVAAPIVEEARAGAEGIRSWQSAEGGGDGNRAAGAVYEMRGFRLGAATCESELQRAAATLVKLPAGAVEPTWSVRLALDVDRQSVTSSLGDWERREREEQAIDRLSEKIVHMLRSSSSLDLFTLHGSSPSVRIHGVAVVDPARREALLIVGRITALTTDRRGP
jgi:hypothetical protein